MCDGKPIYDCDRSTITVLPPISVDFDVNPDAICKNDLPVINALISPIDYNYNYTWYDGPNATGNA